MTESGKGIPDFDEVIPVHGKRSFNNDKTSDRTEMHHTAQGLHSRLGGILQDLMLSLAHHFCLFIGPVQSVRHVGHPNGL